MSPFEYFKKIILTTSLQKTRRGRDSSPLSLLIRYTHALYRTTSTIKANEDHGDNLFVVLEYTFFELHSSAEQISQVQKSQKKLCKPRCRCNQPTTVKVTLLLASCARKCPRFFFCSCLSPVIVYLMMNVNCFRDMVTFISSRVHCQRSSPSRFSDKARAGFEPAKNLCPGLSEWTCAVVITTTPWRHIENLLVKIFDLKQKTNEILTVAIKKNQILSLHQKKLWFLQRRDYNR